MLTGLLGFPGPVYVARAWTDTGAFIFIVMLGFGVLATLAVYVLTIVVETVVRRFLQWDDIWRCFIDSWLINTVSIAAGITLVLIAFGRPIFVARYFELNEAFPSLLIAFIGAWAIFVGLEGVTLWAIRRKAAGVTWRMIPIINVASYVVLVIL